MTNGCSARLCAGGTDHSRHHSPCTRHDGAERRGVPAWASPRWRRSRLPTSTRPHQVCIATRTRSRTWPGGPAATTKSCVRRRVVSEPWHGQSRQSSGTQSRPSAPLQPYKGGTTTAPLCLMCSLCTNERFRNERVADHVTRHPPADDCRHPAGLFVSPARQGFARLAADEDVRRWCDGVIWCLSLIHI